MFCGEIDGGSGTETEGVREGIDGSFGEVSCGKGTGVDCFVSPKSWSFSLSSWALLCRDLSFTDDT